MEGGISRSLWKIATSLGTTPQELFNTLTPLQWEWAFVNYNQDIQDVTELINACHEMLQPWLNPELYQSLQKQKKKIASPAFVTFINELKTRGASQKEIAELLAEEGSTSEEFDKVEVLAAPWLKEKGGTK